MDRRKYWLRLLNVDQGEWWLVRNLMTLQFLQGAGIAFFFTAAFASFLENFEMTSLPWVMILSAVLLWGTGYLYSKLEHRIPMTRLTIVVTVLMVASALFFRFADYFSHGGIMLFVMLAWFHVLYLLNNLQFWGVATLLFDLRQSKRLFGLISSGDIPAKFIGYSLALVAAKSIGTMNMLYAAAVCMALSIPFLLAINRSGKLTVEHEHKAHEHEHVHHGNTKIKALLRNFLQNTFIRDIALISVLAFCCLLLIDYGFYSEIKHRSHSDVELATFISAFQAVVRLLALVAKMIFTGRVMSNMGLRQTLMITPLVMMALVGVIAATEFIDASEKMVFYLFGATFILVDVCRTVFNAPSLITLMQPLPTHERLRAHNIVKGIMDPFAYLITGLLLLLLVKIQHEVSLYTISDIVLVLGIVWLVGIILVNRQYLLILVKTITSRYFSQEEFSLNDENIQQAIRQKISTGNELEVISILKMLNSKTDPIANEMALSLINHPSPQVKLETLKLINGEVNEEISAQLFRLAEDDTQPEIRDEAVRTIAKIFPLQENFTAYLQQPASTVQKAAIAGMVLNADSAVRSMAQEKLAALINSTARMDKLYAADILTQIRDEYCQKDLRTLLEDEDKHVQALGIRAIGRAADTQTLVALSALLPDHGKHVLAAFQAVGEKTVPILAKMLKDPANEAWEEKIIILLGRIGGTASQQVLTQMLSEKHKLTPVIIKSLYRTKYHANDVTLRQMEQIAREYIIYGVELMHMQRIIHERDEHKILKSALHLEIQEIRDVLLALFACMFDRVKMNQAKHGLESNLNENVANAMEIIELTVKKDIGRYFNTMFETTSLDHRCNTLRALLKDIDFAGIDDIISKVLKEKPIQYLDWTKACSMYITKKYLHNIDMGLIHPYVGANSRLVRETAVYAMVKPINLKDVVNRS